MAKRFDGEDTVDAAMTVLRAWQLQGLGVEDVGTHVDYEEIGKHRFPVKVTVTVEMRPLRGGGR